MIDNITQGVFNLVALRKESVDRNFIHVGNRQLGAVALRKESVDRNPGSHLVWDAQNGVALRKESVDRNDLPLQVRRPYIRRSPQGERG